MTPTPTPGVTPTPTATPTSVVPCDEDMYEDNDSCAAAAPLAAGLYEGLKMCPFDEDWYAIDLASADSLQVDMLFTHLAVPVMTRLRQPQRQVLDTLVDAGVARSRADALVWCVRLVGDHAQEWLSELRQAMGAVDKLRAQGPSL